MMALLLTFFILLVSMSELKRDDKFQGMADSIGERFGGDGGKSAAAVESGRRNGALAALVNANRMRQANLLRTECRANAPWAALAFPETRRCAGRRPTRVLDLAAQSPPPLRGILEIRSQAAQAADWDAAYQRARLAADYLAELLPLAPEQIRLTVSSGKSGRLEIWSFDLSPPESRDPSGLREARATFRP